ncbi:MAG: hypothetical protein ACKO43_07320 [Alphaproteobacteria bacterium]
MNRPNETAIAPKRPRYPLLRRLTLLLVGAILVFAGGLAVGHYGDGFFKESPAPAPQPAVNLEPMQNQLDRIEGVLTELSHRIPQSFEAPAPAPAPLSFSLLGLGSLDLSEKASASSDKPSLGSQWILARDLVDDLLLFFAAQPLTPRDVESLIALMQNLFPEKKTDDLLILRSSFTHLVSQAEGLVLLPEPIVGAGESPAAAPARASFWSSLLGYFVTVRAPGQLNADDASGVPEVVSVYNDAYDAWQNTILPALRKGRLDEAAALLETLDARALFAEDARWQQWKQDFQAWLRCYLWLRSARMDMTRQMIQDMTQTLPSSGALPPPALSLPENPIKPHDGGTP